MTVKMTQKLIAAAMGKSKVDLLLKNANVIDVFAERVTPTSIAISSGYIVGFGDYAAKEEWDLAGAYVCPGLIDSHIHLESSMLSPAEYSRAACACGTTAVVCDPHEI
ncbi:MAG: adenine deaminase, partial [Clostridia bacterium]|nr:adenine deaminase [Clostridia bacterium]